MCTIRRAKEGQSSHARQDPEREGKKLVQSRDDWTGKGTKANITFLLFPLGSHVCSSIRAYVERVCTTQSWSVGQACEASSSAHIMASEIRQEMLLQIFIRTHCVAGRLCVPPPPYLLKKAVRDLIHGRDETKKTKLNGPFFKQSRTFVS